MRELVTVLSLVSCPLLSLIAIVFIGCMLVHLVLMFSCYIRLIMLVALVIGLAPVTVRIVAKFFMVVVWALAPIALVLL